MVSQQGFHCDTVHHLTAFSIHPCQNLFTLVLSGMEIEVTTSHACTKTACVVTSPPRTMALLWMPALCPMAGAHSSPTPTTRQMRASFMLPNLSLGMSCTVWVPACMFVTHVQCLWSDCLCLKSTGQYFLSWWLLPPLPHPYPPKKTSHQLFGEITGSNTWRKACSLRHHHHHHYPSHVLAYRAATKLLHPCLSLTSL